MYSLAYPGLVPSNAHPVQSVTSNDQSWGSDNSNFVGADSPWSIRGGNSNNSSNAGLFSANSNNGNANNNIGFRAVQRVANKRSYRALRRRGTYTHTLRSLSFFATIKAVTLWPKEINNSYSSPFFVSCFTAEHRGLLFCSSRRRSKRVA